MNDLRELQDCLDIRDIQKILGIKKEQASQLVNSDLFSSKVIDDRQAIETNDFMKWLFGRSVG